MYRAGLFFLWIPIIWLAVSGPTNAQSPKEKPADYLLKNNPYPLIPNRSAEQFLKENGTSLEQIDKKYPLPQDPKKILKYRESRLKEIRSDFSESISHFGKSKSDWAALASETIESYCHYFAHRNDLNNSGIYFQAFQETLKRTIAAGCDDAVIRSMQDRYQFRENLKNADIQKVLESIEAVDKSIHSPMLIATIALDARLALRWNPTNKPNPDKEKLARGLSELLDKSIKEISTSTRPISRAALYYLITSHSSAILNLERKSASETWKAYEEVLSASKGHEWLRAMLEGKMWYDWAWEARGTGFSDTVTPERQTLFEQRMKKAESKLEEAWKLDPSLDYSANYLIGVMTALSRERGEMEKWFAKAMECNPDNYYACSQKLNYLQPSWHGKEVDYLGFMAQCYNTNNQYSAIPRLFEKAFGVFPNDPELQKKFFETPGVWANYNLMANVHLNHYPDDRFIITRMVLISLKSKQWDSALSFHERLDGKPPWPGLFASNEDYKKQIEFAEKQ